jgi:hypothetical protein
MYFTPQCPFPSALHSALLLTLPRQFFMFTIIIFIIILGLGSTNDLELVIFGLLNLAYFAQHDELQFHLVS